MSVLAIITARGGSTGLPGKNIRAFAGKPLIAHSILAAREAGEVVDRIIVSTDDGKIAGIARECGADVPFLRPPELARDDTPSLPVVQHALEFVEREEGRTYDQVLLLQPTSPLRTAGDIRSSLAMAGPGTTAVISVTDASGCHPVKLRTIENGLLRPFSGDGFRQVRRQDFGPPLYKTNGAIYLTRRDTLMEAQEFYGPAPLAYVMPPERSIDIDTETDFAVAEFLYLRSQGTRADA